MADVPAISRIWTDLLGTPPIEDEIRAYRSVFGVADARNFVIPDLARFCGAVMPMPADPAMMQRAAGRQDVWFRIRHAIDIDDDDIYRLVHGGGAKWRQQV